MQFYAYLKKLYQRQYQASSPEYEVALPVIVGGHEDDGGLEVDQERDPVQEDEQVPVSAGRRDSC
jgi:hypothetical protein